MTCTRAQKLVPVLILTEGDLDAEWVPALRRHLVECAACSGLYDRQLQLALSTGWSLMAEMPEDVRKRMSALGHDQSRRARAATALQQAAATTSHPTWRRRLQDWCDQWQARAEGAARIVMDAPRGATRIMVEGVEALLKPRPGLAFGYAAPRVRGGGTVRTRGRKPGQTLAVADGIANVMIHVGEAERAVTVHLRNLPSEQPVPLLALVAESGGTAAAVIEPEYDCDEDCFVARFDAVSSGTHILLVEPMR